jgi:hypothetical protein
MSRSGTLVVAVLLMAVVAVAARAQSLSVQVSRGWDALNAKNYSAAIQIASGCARQFSGQALSEEDRLKANKAPIYAAGRRDINSPTAQAILANGVLNDTAACLFILGTAQEALSQCKDALTSFRSLAVLTHALIWDPNGWFWAPSEAAEDAVRRLSVRC